MTVNYSVDPDKSLKEYAANNNRRRPGRNTNRADVRYGDEYLSKDGTPLYKIKNRNPLGYGRRKRNIGTSIGY